jgi:5-methylcytosine-specific restriction endonuclease McrBC regulatory subunit McrC
MYGKQHTYYYTCPYCGANLDPGETCDCQKITEQSDDTINEKENLSMNIRGENDVLPFVTLEDITKMKKDMNYVIWNYKFPMEKRIAEFKKIMSKISSHEFGDNEIEYLAECKDPTSGSEFIRRTRKILFDVYSV